MRRLLITEFDTERAASSVAGPADVAQEEQHEQTCASMIRIHRTYPPFIRVSFSFASRRRKKERCCVAVGSLSAHLPRPTLNSDELPQDGASAVSGVQGAVLQVLHNTPTGPQTGEIILALLGRLAGWRKAGGRLATTAGHLPSSLRFGSIHGSAACNTRYSNARPGPI
jgi:hypothetical protein